MRLFLLLSAFSLPCFAINLNLSPKQLNEGQTALLRISGLGSPQKAVSGEFEGHPLLFFTCPGDPRQLCAFIPVAMGTKNGEYPVVVSLSGQISHRTMLKIVSGTYREEVLKVDSSRVELSPENLKRAQDEGRELGQIFEVVTPRQIWKQGFIYPGPAKVTSAFGNKRLFNGELKSYHSGVDLRGNQKTRVRAANAGVVQAAKNFFFSGNMVVIDHGYGVFSSYAHMSRIDVKVGQSVKRGDVLGRAGATGRVTGPHIHWGMRVSGIKVDPLQFRKVFSSLWADAQATPKSRKAAGKPSTPGTRS